MSARSRSPRLGTWQFSQDLRPQLPAAFCMEGFQTKRFNVTFRARHGEELRVSGLPTYWDECGELFIYWQVHGSRWTVCCRKDDHNKDLLSDVKKGGEVGLAFEEADPGFWSEYLDESGFVSTKGVRLRALDHGLSSSPSMEEPQRGKRISRWRKEAQQRAAANGRGPRPKSVEDMKRLLESDPDVEEVFLIQGPKEAGLVVSFRSVRSASDALELGRGLLGDPEVVDKVSHEELQRLREHSRGSYRPNPVRQAVKDVPPPVVPAEPAAERPQMDSGINGIDLQEALLEQEVKQEQQLPAAAQLPAAKPEDIQTEKGLSTASLEVNESMQKALKQLQELVPTAQDVAVDTSPRKLQQGDGVAVAKSKGARAKAKARADATPEAAPTAPSDPSDAVLPGLPESDKPSPKEKKVKDKKEKKAKRLKQKQEMEERMRKEVEEELRLEEARPCGPGRRPKWRLGSLRSLRQADAKPDGNPDRPDDIRPG